MDSAVFLGNSHAIVSLVEEATQIAPTDSKVLITGESGVGKELLARLIHDRSSRCRRPLIPINCGGVAETLLESELFGHVRGSFTDAHRDRRGILETANGGTVLLDEVGEMSLRMQALLLRFLENGEIQRVGSEGHHTTTDVRVISATNRDLRERARENHFREDLYYRLNVVHLVIPPLRARREDIALLFEHYLRVLSEQHRVPVPTLAVDAVADLEDHSWPGNVRELRNVAERIVLRHHGRVIARADLAQEIVKQRPARPAAPVRRMPPAEKLAVQCLERIITNKESFWTVVYEPFMSRDLMRDTVRAVVREALTRTRGSYRLAAELLNLPSDDYKRFLNFLNKYDCHIAFQNFRLIPPSREMEKGPATKTG